MTSNILIYQTEDGQTKIETVLQDERGAWRNSEIPNLLKKPPTSTTY